MGGTGRPRIAGNHPAGRIRFRNLQWPRLPPLLEDVELQPGLVILVPNEKAAIQRALFLAAMATIGVLPNTINKVIEIHGTNDIRIADLPNSK